MSLRNCRVHTLSSLDKMLGDPAAKTRLLQKLGLDETPRGSKDKTDNVDDGSSSESESVEDSQGKRKQLNIEALVNITPSGKSVGASCPLPPFWWPPFPGYSSVEK